jgi:tetratricopeptide (TPR) repeat protein
MAYGISGDTSKARSIFESAIARDPDYPMYYYNLACADAQEKKLGDARIHLQQAFARKTNMIPGETLPDPSKDDSFLPYQNEKDFWQFVESLH